MRQARTEAALHEVPFAVVEDIGNSQILSSVSARASEVGIYKGQPLRFGPEYIIPKPFDPRVLLRLAPAVAQAACTAEYKAKQDNPLRLQHGEMQVSSCDPSAAAAEVQARLAQQGWILLKIVSLKG